MNLGIIYMFKDSDEELFLNFIDEALNNDLEKRFLSYLEEYEHVDDSTQYIIVKEENNESSNNWNKFNKSWNVIYIFKYILKALLLIKSYFFITFI